MLTPLASRMIETMMTEKARVTDTVYARLIKEVERSYPAVSRMLPSDVKQTLRDAIEGAYISGFNHGAKEGEKYGASK